MERLLELDGRARFMRSADIVAERLHRAGVRHAFGMPGGEVLTVVDALEKAGIAFHLCRHENAAGFIAEGVYHRTGAPAVLVATVGPGALNAINVVENAREDRIPMIVLTGCVDAAVAQTYTHQVLDQSRVFDSVSKASFTLDADAAGVIIDKALAISTEGRPGPVHIDIPISVAAAIGTPYPMVRAPALPSVPSEPLLKELRASLSKATKPLLMVGLDAVNQGAGEAVIEAAERLGAPVITTYKAKGIIPETHDLALGGAGLSPKADAILLPLIKQADAIVAVGYDPVEMRQNWLNPWDPANQTIIDITAEPNRHYMHQSTHNIIGDCAATLKALLPEAVLSTWLGGEPAETRAALKTAFAPPENWGPGQIIETCRRVLPENTLASVDSGAHRILLSQMWTCTYEKALVQSTGLCTMGCAVPLAIGMSMIEPQRPVVAFSGDAGFLMVLGELATAAEHGLNTIFVIFEDRSLALIELKQRQMQMPNAGVDFPATDFATIARGFGGTGVAVTSKHELETALQAALEADSFTVIAAQFDRQAYDGTF